MITRDGYDDLWIMMTVNKDVTCEMYALVIYIRLTNFTQYGARTSDRVALF